MPNVNFTGFKRIVADPEYCDGQPRIEGTRITVGAILSYLAGGMNVVQIVEDYPPYFTNFNPVAYRCATLSQFNIPNKLSTKSARLLRYFR